MYGVDSPTGLKVFDDFYALLEYFYQEGLTTEDIAKTEVYRMENIGGCVIAEKFNKWLKETEEP